MVLFCDKYDDTKDPVSLRLSTCLGININVKWVPQGGKMAAAFPCFTSGGKIQR